MNIGIIVNPKSGRNRAATLAQRSRSLLEQRGHRVITMTTDAAERPIHDFLSDTERLIIIGGDGTVHHTLPALITHQIPFYHLATGTSNLIAKEFGMPKSPIKAVDWIEQGGSMTLDVPTIDTVPFLIMTNFGMDASVIHRFERARKRSGGFRHYVLPVIRELLRPGTAKLTVSADGITLKPQSHTNLLIANMRSYALQINPCPNADPTDGMLDLLASQCSTTLGWSLNTNLSRCRLPIPSSQRVRCTNITITSIDQPSPAQCDGEIAITPTMPKGILDRGQSVEIHIGKHRIPILTKPNP